MSNVVPFPPRSSAAQTAGRHLAARLLERPPACSHAVQFYDDPGFLVDTVAQFVLHGLDAGHSVLAIATAEHTDGLIERLGKARVASALAEKRLVLADADALLARFMVGGQMSAPAFRSTLDLVLRDLPAAAAGRPWRAFGEMVDRLWQQGHATAALQLEEAWCSLCDELGIALLCGYAMSNFYKQAESQRFHEVCRLHSHVLPTEKFTRQAVSDFDQLREISLLEQRERLLQGEVFYREQLERALRELSPDNVLPGAGVSTCEDVAPPPSERAARLLRAASDLLEHASEIAAIARELSSRYSQQTAGGDVARLNAALERLQHAAAQLPCVGRGPTLDEASGLFSPNARPR